MNEAHRVYLVARVVPGWTRAETDEAPAVLLDRLIAVDVAHRNAEAKAQNPEG